MYAGETWDSLKFDGAQLCLFFIKMMAILPLGPRDGTGNGQNDKNYDAFMKQSEI